MLTINQRALHAPYPVELKHILNLETAKESLDCLSHWNKINTGATPLWPLPGLAAQFGLGQLCIKDESKRSALGSFKVLGAPIALLRMILRLWPDSGFDAAGLIQGRHQNAMRNLTVISATDGNHGRALAAAAQSIGCRCVIVLHARVSSEREEAIAAYGAQIVRINGNYDDSVNDAARLAKAHEWHVVSDTSYDGYEEIPRDVMRGYGAIAHEIIAQTHSRPDEPAFTHVFLQGGVGGFAAGVAGSLWDYHARFRPRFIVVEPQEADCLYQSASSGQLAPASGSTDSVMAGLACGEASPLAWRILELGVDAFQTVSDEEAVRAMQLLATGSATDIPIVAGESGAAGLAGLAALCRNPTQAKTIGLDGASRVLLINTEGATAPSVYSELVHEPAKSVLRRQTAWLADNHKQSIPARTTD